MRRIVKYKSIDPYYSDVVQTYIGSSVEEIDNIQYETERHMSNFHASLGMIYKTEVLEDDTDNLLILKNKNK